jgi:Arc/MetJ-type ribon-helix-helix transcriptional regulator
MPLAEPLSVQLTHQQRAWLDSRRSPGLSRSAVIRLVIQEAMSREQEQSK